MVTDIYLRTAYVATPVKPVLRACSDERRAWDEIYAIATRAAIYVANKLDYVPYSPVLAFRGVFDELAERNRILESCFHMLRNGNFSAFVWCKCGDYTAMSGGMHGERAIAHRLGIKILEVTL